RTWHELYIEPRFQVHDTLNQPAKIDILLLRWRKLGESRVGLQKTAERIGPGSDRVQSGTRVILPIWWERIAPHERFQTGRERFDRSQRVVHLVTEDTYDSLPGATFLFAQRPTQVG